MPEGAWAMDVLRLTVIILVLFALSVVFWRLWYRFVEWLGISRLLEKPRLFFLRCFRRR